MFSVSRIAARRTSAARLRRNLHDLRVGVLNETKGHERRVALVPKHVETLIGKGAAVQVVKDAGVAAGFSNEMYEKAGATIVSAEDVWKSDMVLAINQPALADLKKLENRAITAQLQPRSSPEVVDQLAQQGATALSLDMLLRTLSRGQAFDVLSSQANCAGYRAVIEAGYLLGKRKADGSGGSDGVRVGRCIIYGVSRDNTGNCGMISWESI